MEESWRDVRGYEGLYQASNRGRVRSVKRNVIYPSSTHHPSPRIYVYPERLLRLPLDKDGYQIVSLKRNNKQKTGKVHRLVAQAFIPNPNNSPQVNHLDGNKQNNCIGNLEWCSSSQNRVHGFKIGLMSQRGEKNNASKLTNKDVKEIRIALAKGNSSKQDIAKRFQVSPTTIGNIEKKKVWAHVN